MSDIVKQLKDWCVWCHDHNVKSEVQKVMYEAIEEIERLRAAIAEAYEPGCDCATCKLYREALRDE